MQAGTSLAIDILVDVVGATLALDIIGHANCANRAAGNKDEEDDVKPGTIHP